MAKPASIEGCLTALVTPFSGGKVDFDKLARLVDWQIENGVDGIVSVGTTGESATLDVDEHVAVIAATVKAAKGRVPVVAGAGGAGDPAVLERPCFLEILEAQEDLVVPRRRVLRAIELRGVAPQGLRGGRCAGVVRVVLGDVA